MAIVDDRFLQDGFSAPGLVRNDSVILVGRPSRRPVQVYRMRKPRRCDEMAVFPRQSSADLIDSLRTDEIPMPMKNVVLILEVLVER